MRDLLDYLMNTSGCGEHKTQPRAAVLHEPPGFRLLAPTLNVIVGAGAG
jgi:hypothetical protein